MVIPKIELEDRIEILLRKKLNISRFFDIVEVEIEGEDSKRDYIFLLKASPFRRMPDSSHYGGKWKRPLTPFWRE